MAPPPAAGPTPGVREGQRVRLSWMPPDLDGEVIATFPGAGSVRVKFFITKDRFDGLNDTQRGRLRPVVTNTYVVEVDARYTLEPAAVGVGEDVGGEGGSRYFLLWSQLGEAES